MTQQETRSWFHTSSRLSPTGSGLPKRNRAELLEGVSCASFIICFVVRFGLLTAFSHVRHRGQLCVDHILRGITRSRIGNHHLPHQLMPNTRHQGACRQLRSTQNKTAA
ncbi:hypothetical protein CB0940_05653 [Cercospora beticola]|uniref:Uncharacterized protein n=1 Tax=Cercospora beticola TaxID=122368 RepID=A0A2G5HXV9_CERBT|nr:hypothetical protein CB0940_05653 [Cercospora beticola]PIA97350.1 hypothetical protein CB0940_05653 [Cercospora beticola]